jgi:hypothetical protein
MWGPQGTENNCMWEQKSNRTRSHTVRKKIVGCIYNPLALYFGI